MPRTKYFDVTVLAANAEELDHISEELRAVRIDDLLYAGERTGCGSFRLQFEAYNLAGSHLVGVSAAFPSAVFLMEAYGMDSFTQKMVFQGGRLLRATSDNDSHVLGGIWVLLNIFATFKVEYELGLPVGSLWDEWVADVTKAAHELRVPPGWATEPPEPLHLTFTDELPGVARQPKPGEPKDLVQKQMCDGVWRTLCNLCHRPSPASWEVLVMNGDEDFGYDPDRPVYFEVTPCNVTLDYMPLPWGADGYRESWRKQKSMTFVICAECFFKLGVTQTQLPASFKGDNFQDGVVAPSSVVEPPEDERTPEVEHDFPPLEELRDLV